MECNIGQDAICFQTHSEILHMYINKGRLIKNIGKYYIIILQRNLHEIFNAIL